MSIFKHSISIREDEPEPQQLQQQQVQQGDRKSLNAHRILTRIYDDLCDQAPNYCRNLTKYDLIALNLDEVMLLQSYRDEQARRIEKKSIKLKKIVKRFTPER